MEFKTKPWSHQRDVVTKIEKENRKSYALLWDMGTGKTKAGVDILRLIYGAYGPKRTIIICPVPVMENWKREILTHSHIPERFIQVVDGQTKPDGKKLKNSTKALRLKQLEARQDQYIFILNTENVSNKDLWDIILKMGIEVLLVDEMHRFKSPQGKRTKALHKLADQPQCRFKYGLTGTPILQSALDLWSQYYILDPNILGGNYFAFRSRYFYDKNASMPSHVHFPDWVPKDKAYYDKMGLPFESVNSSLHNIIYEHSSRVMKDDVLDLPPRTYQTLEVELSKEQQRLYEEMRRDAVAFLEDDMGLLKLDHISDIQETMPEYMKADLAITKILRLQQLVCGVFTNSEGQTKAIPTKRISVLQELLEELLSVKSNKVIIWTHFTPTYEEIKKVCELCGQRPVMLTGQQDKEEKQEAIDQFNINPHRRVMIANQGAGGTGVNLTAANYDIYYSRSFNLEHDMQSNARTYRGGQKRKTTRIDLVAPGTIDEEIVEALARKREGAEDILASREREFSRDEIIKMLGVK